MYVYILSEKNEYGNLYTVGFYKPNGEFSPESDHSSKDDAVKRVNYLNGGKNA